MRVPLLVFAFLSLAAPARAERVVIDLATSAASTSVSRAPGTVLTFEIHNKLPLAGYSAVVTTHHIPVPAFPAPPAIGLGTMNTCDAVLEDSDAVYSAEDEGSLAAPMARIAEAVRAGSCPGPVGDRLATTLAQTRLTLPGSYPVRAGEEVVVTITRGDKAWVHTFSGGSRGAWQVTYGASVVADRSRRMTLKGDDEAGYVITPEARAEGVRVLPSIYFTWMATPRLESNWAFGPTAGLGIDKKAPGLFGGWSATYNQNLIFMAGVSLAQHQRLRGKYSAGETLKESLDAEQLMEGVYLPSWLLGITFRFGANPFGQKAAEEQPGDKADGKR